ncbi:zinc/cadmium/mercury/lead-transporting ATPase [Endozoicomonas sp. SCSIO W0465]|uniref:zinc/cadmium/mercury/lead-transporting ATPase n=1 Tax=Endozoicomonas sp. SCSIO W0465 TaxID=2918516 RepID=UPI002076271F|nr:zinc/cadmium/mercury/lead-transporting ATPase [Endozoicomonas sp. SCSIO W0465]USE37015.1 zinc/cadmium/mercury/lead-transporting ATPase [Endozoicomonas sp. SCSIO W0465]
MKNSCAAASHCSNQTQSEGSSIEKNHNPSACEYTQLTWLISGMDCPSCATKIENAVKGLTGVNRARVTFATERLLVRAENRANIGDDILTTIEALGFSVKDDRSSEFAAKSFLKKYWRIISLALVMLFAVLIQEALPAVGNVLFYLATLWGLFPVAAKAWQLARNGSPFSIETLMSIAAIGALFLGETIEAAMVLLLFMIGEHMEAFAAGRARQGIQKLTELTPETAYQIDQKGNKSEVSAHILKPGDIIEILPGSRLPVDGELLTPGVSFDESALTGESVPIEYNAGERVMAGALSVDRVARFRVISRPGESAVDRIIRLIEEAEERKAPVERFIDTFSRWYTPLMMFMAILVAFVPPLVFSQPWGEWIYKALTLLLIACPCALVISTPAAVTSALARASRNGALIKGGAILELLGSVTTVAFDKTGTLTEGKPAVTQIVSFDTSTLSPEQAVLRLAAAIESGSTHPLAKAIVASADEIKISLPVAEGVEVKPGLGVQGLVEGKIVVVGSPRHLQGSIDRIAGAQHKREQLEEQGNTIAVVTVEGHLVGFIVLRDNPRTDAQSAITALNTMGIKSVMLTGDNPRAATAIARQLGMEYRAGLLPGDKSTEVEQLKNEGRVAMIGDGINDAPALKAADIGIAMGSGADVALETADGALTHNRVEELPALIDLSRSTMTIIRQNVFLAVGSKAVFLVTTLLGMTGLWVAVLADTGATALVTANALRLLRNKKKG